MLFRPPFVIEVTPDPSIAAGASPGPGEWLRRALPESDVVYVRPGNPIVGTASPNGTQPVVVVRDAHRHPWQQEVVEEILARSSDAIVVEVGLPFWRPSGPVGYIATYGSARVNLEAAAERLSGAT